MWEGLFERVDKLGGPGPAVDFDHHVWDEEFFDEQRFESGQEHGQGKEPFLGYVHEAEFEGLDERGGPDVSGLGPCG